MIKKIFWRLTVYLLSVLRKSKVSYILFPQNVYHDIHVLNKDGEHYYLKKCMVSGILMMSGVFLTIGYFILESQYGVSEVQEIRRPEIYEELTTVEVELQPIGEIYALQVAPRMLSKEEADTLIKEVTADMDKYILLENTSLNDITSNLFLPSEIAGYPFEIYWESDKEQIIDIVGNINRYELKEDELVTLTAALYYGDWVWENQFVVCVKKEQLSEEERYKRELKNLLIKEEEKQRTEEVFVLPEEYENENIIYGICKDNNSILLLGGLMFLAAIVLWVGQDNDLRIAREKRRAVFEAEYIPLVSSLSMYISAGATLQTAMNLCVKDYIERKPRENIVRTALLEFQKDIQNGYSFTAALERFSKSADEENYHKLSGLLSQGILNGSNGLKEALEEEVRNIQEEKRRKSKVKGEQVSTALIGPMMLQLAIVIALIMIPAFSNMQF